MCPVKHRVNVPHKCCFLKYYRFAYATTHEVACVQQICVNGTVYSGEDVSREATLSDEFVEKAVESLAKIHDHAILGDLTKNNVLRHKDIGEPMFIVLCLAKRADIMSPADFENSAEAEREQL